MQKEYVPLVNLFAEELKRHPGGFVTSLALYGSVARGTAKPISDIDFLIIGEKVPEPYHQRVKMVLPVLNTIEQSSIYQEMESRGYLPQIRFVIYSKEEARETRPLFIDLVEDAVILFDDGFLQGKLEEIRQRMRELGSRRVYLPDGTWYWDLKPDLVPGEVFEI